MVEPLVFVAYVLPVQRLVKANCSSPENRRHGRSQGRGLSRQDITTTARAFDIAGNIRVLTIEDYAHVIDWPRRRR
jgi:hypothetical protein